jgi:hypothetical protein
MCTALKRNIMRSHGYAALTASLLVLVIVLLCAAGCTTAQKTDTATPAPTSAASSAGVISATAAVKTANIDTTIGVHFNDYACLDVQKEMRVSYLYPDEKYILSATTPGPGTVNVNIIFLDTNDHIALQAVQPKWDNVNKKWEYEGIVPVVQFNDVTAPVQKTFTIKNQGQYYLCVDDRKETGVNDAIYQVPVKLLKIA